MQFRGKLWKTEGHPPWVIQVRSLGVTTQGQTKKEAIAMLKDAIELYIDYYFEKKAQIEIIDHSKGTIGVACSDQKLLLSLSLIKQRELQGLTIREVTYRLGSTSPNSYARYERGNVNMSVEKFDELLQALNPESKGMMLSFGT